MYIYIVKINLRNLKNVMTQKVKLERCVQKCVSKFKVESVKCVKSLINIQMKRQRKTQGEIAKNAYYTDGYIMAHLNQILRNVTA